MILAEENVERDAVHKALLSLLRQDVKGNFIYLKDVEAYLCILNIKFKFNLRSSLFINIINDN